MWLWVVGVVNFWYYWLGLIGLVIAVVGLGEGLGRKAVEMSEEFLRR